MTNIVQKMIENDKRQLSKIDKLAKKVESYADEIEQLTDEELRGKTTEFQERLKKGETLDDILPEGFAVVREAAKRVLGMFPFHVQIMGGIVLHNGDIPEMRTGEGKTLTLTMPIYLNALEKKGVHVVTVNEYLTERDCTEMGELFEFLGLTVGLNISTKSPDEKREAYLCDITYSTNAELGFDYLRDNMVVYKSQMVQRPLNFVIIDEVDSVLIDEARTPLIISGAGEETTDVYDKVDEFVKTLEDEDYTIDEQSKTISINYSGIDKAEEFFKVDNLYDWENTALTHYMDQSLRANYLMIRDKDYVVSDGKVMIVDQFTGRVMDGRRYSDGLHQAIEAKEKVEIQDESKTKASITYQNYFRMYQKLSGTTGTGKTEKEEFREIYNMQILPIPTNNPIQRIDFPDLLYPTLEAKYNAVVQTVREKYSTKQPILVGTASVEASEAISEKLKVFNIPHEVLNAKNHHKEADIVRDAGQKGAVTIATNMAGRGTDIKLGVGVKELGGLCVIGTELAESRRIDNQLRGRAGRQGDPGFTQFYLSLEDDLMIRFGSERIKKVLDALKLEGDEAVIESKFLSKQVESAQKRVEGNNYDTRKNVLQYDDVMREQREIIYKQRLEIIDETDDMKDIILSMVNRSIRRVIDAYTTDEDESKWGIEEIVKFANEVLTKDEEVSVEELRGKTPHSMHQLLKQKALHSYESQVSILDDPELIREFQKVVILRVVDEKWTNHIDDMDQLRQSIGLRSYGQQNPIVEYQTEGYRMFEDLIASIEYDVTRLFMKANIKPREQVHQVEDLPVASQ